jgi:hypothetical protein
MARFLPYVCFIVLILLLCMEAQAGRLGSTPDDEGQELFLLLSYYFLSLSLSLSLSLYIYIYIYMCVCVCEIFDHFRVGGNENLNIN